MNRPLILLDVDGPLNPYAAKATRRPVGYTTHRLRPQGWERAERPLRVWLAPEHGPQLLALAEEFDAELVWATTWMHDANTMIGPVIGLPELPVIDYGRHPGTVRGWKYPATLDFARDRALVWLDDDFAAPDRVSHRDSFVASREAQGFPTNLYHVDPRIGLTILDMQRVGRWLRNLKESND